jgi:hypothetical protein
MVKIFWILVGIVMAINIYIYGFASCDSWLMKIRPQREIPGRCLTNLK